MFKKRQNNDNDTSMGVNIRSQLNDGYLEELEKQFSTTFDDQYDEDFKLSTKCKILVGISTVAIAMLIMVIMFIVMPSVSKENEAEEKVVTKTKVVEEDVPLATKDPHEGMVRSRLTGTWVKEEIANKRPYAIMFNNIKAASPQSGTSYADIMYEAVVEGGITRLMGIYSSLPSCKIGSIRSARPYYVSLAKEHDALYVHVGGSDDAKNKIASLDVADIDGNKSKGSEAIYRDSSARAPHNAFTTASKLESVVKKSGYRTNYRGKDGNHFVFNEEMTELGTGNKCRVLRVTFSSYSQVAFAYYEDSKMYGRYQFGSRHRDKSNGEQLLYSNVIIQYVNEWTLDEAGRQAMDIYNSSGKGIYFTGGQYKNITWTRNESRGTMQYKDEDGNILKVNPGKTYIGLVPRENSSKTVIK